ncbi:MAG: helix-turn-helix domain-containing protein [Bacteroidetes bacterium]|nr:helix-turn-helix domain-containing protein [Bacteroidota bacterium]
MEKTENKNQGVPLKPYTLKELARIYGVSTKTMHRWMEPFEKELGIKRGRYYTIPQVKMFFDNLSLPSIYNEI